jgi:hypothetical protein
VAANFRNKISMPTKEKSCHGVKGPPIFSCGFVRVILFQVVFGVESGQSTFHANSFFVHNILS